MTRLTVFRRATALLAILNLVLFNLLSTGAAFASWFEAPKLIKPGQKKVSMVSGGQKDAVRTAIKYEIQGRNIMIAAGSYQLGGASFILPKWVFFRISDCPVVKRVESVETLNETDIDKFVTNSTRRSAAAGAVKRFKEEVLVPNSGEPIFPAKIQSCSRELMPEQIEFQNNNLDHAQSILDGRLDLMSIAILDSKFLDTIGESIKLMRGQGVKQVSYEVNTRRLDVIATDPQGNMKVFQGEPTELGPEPPTIPAGFIPIINVYATPKHDDLKDDDVLPVKLPNALPFSDPWKSDNMAELSEARAKLASGAPFKVLFWGDSITCGGFATVKSAWFAHQFIDGLKKKYPASEITYVNQGHSGTTSNIFIEDFKRLLILHKPDLCTIEFVNDYTLTTDAIRKYYERLFKEAAEQHVPLLVIIPHTPAPEYLHLETLKEVVNHPFPTLLRQMCKDHHIAYVDVSARYGRLKDEGYRLDMVFSDQILHPNNFGHKVYAEEMLSCF
jgi:lysophospholipase L1-like esterase